MALFRKLRQNAAMEEKKAARGRPSRTALEAVRVVIWYYEVRRLSGLSESKLEVAFDQLNRVELGRHGGSRWNKYKAGITTPGQDMLRTVGNYYSGAYNIFHHPVWALAADGEIGWASLRGQVARLPVELQVLFVRKEAPTECDFWIIEELDHRAVIDQLLKWFMEGYVSRLTALAALLVLIHDGQLRQREAQHFDSHVAVSVVAALQEPARDDEFAAFTAWRLESILLQRWVRTQYADAERLRRISELCAISSGPLVPWAHPQASLKLGRGPNKKEVADLQASKGYWVGQRVAAWREQERRFDQEATGTD